jgi:2-polyprenyl-6-methoxyphenol hydroxylase-like FAD-dependent oxidoreductase
MAVFLQIAGTRPVRLDAGEAATLLRTAGGAAADEARAVAATIRADDEVVTRAAFALTTRRSVHGRVVLVGDAAHAVSPTTTQGGGLAVEDAVVLGEEISRHGCTPAALAAFEERRRRRVGRFVRAADQHVALMEAVQRAPRARSQSTDSVGSTGSAGDAPVDASRWFQRLYAPLSTAP